MIKHFKRRRRIQESNSGADTSQMMNLSLFIMLLAFFIVLNSLSSYEEIKTEKVKRSIEMSFSKDPQVEPMKASTAPDPVQAMSEGHTFDRLDALFNAQIASFEAVQSKSRGVMMVQVPLEDFTKAVMAIGQKDVTRYASRRDVKEIFFLPTLVSILRTNIDGAPTRMEISLNVPENPAELQNQSPEKIAAVVIMGGQFAQLLERKGMPQKLINIGVSKGDPKMVDLVFRKYIPFSPVGLKKEGERE